MLCRGCPALYSSVDKLSLGFKIMEFFLRNVQPVLNFQRRNSSWKKIEAIDKGRSIRLIPYPFQIYSIFSAWYKLTWDVASWIPFSLEGARKRFLFYNQSFFVISPIKSIPFLKFSRNHLRSTLGITWGRGSLAVHFGDHLRYCRMATPLIRPIFFGPKVAVLTGFHCFNYCHWLHRLLHFQKTWKKIGTLDPQPRQKDRLLESRVEGI